MDFEKFAARIVSLDEIESFSNPGMEYMEEKRFIKKGGEME